MRAFEDAGHVGVLIVGDYTTRIGDPSGRSTERPILSDEEIDRNAKAYFEQAKQIIDPERTEVRFNGEWLGKLDFAEVVRLTRAITVARLLERDDFAKRFAAKAPISVSELLYPMMQAYDSVAVEADVELGGTDQLYNLVAGRDVMERYGLEPQLVVTYPLLVGTDGVEKMSKSRGNYVGILEPAEEMFGKVMSIPDAALEQWWALLAGGGEHPESPMEWKLELARRIVTRWHGEEGARAGEGHFTRVVRRHEAPEEVPEATFEAADGMVYLPGLLVTLAGNSASHWRRQIDQGGVRLDGRSVTAYEVAAATLDGALLQAGKRQFFRLRPV
jgi:tyrosyl-tRNA synthetase